jgi:hypothetical protein
MLMDGFTLETSVNGSKEEDYKLSIARRTFSNFLKANTLRTLSPSRIWDYQTIILDYHDNDIKETNEICFWSEGNSHSMMLWRGEYLETVYMRSRYVLQIYVYGDSFQSYLVAVVVPNPEALIPWAKQNEITVYFSSFKYFQ